MVLLRKNTGKAFIGITRDSGGGYPISFWAAMLVIAAVIEAFWSPSGVPSIWKYVVGTGLWLLVILYLALAGRGK